MTELVLSNISAFVLCVLLIVILRRVSVAFALVDHPDARKRHSGAIPLCGGMAVFIAFAAVSAFSGQLSSLGMQYWAGIVVVLLIGVADDRFRLSPRTRLITELLVAALLIAALDVSNLPGSMFEFEFPLAWIFAGLVAVFFIVGLVNAWNMLDGVDGLAGGAAAVALMWLMFVAAHVGASGMILPLEVLLVTLCGFLIFNMRSPWRARASIFLGDAGSTALGATLSYVILMLAAGKSPVPFAALLWIVFVPVLDTLSLMVRRKFAGRSAMSADRWHMHHLLIDSGVSPAMTTAILTIASAICGGVGFAGILMHVPGTLMAIGLVVPAAVHTAIVVGARTSHPVWTRLSAPKVASQQKEAVARSSVERDFAASMAREKTRI